MFCVDYITSCCIMCSNLFWTWKKMTGVFFDMGGGVSQHLKCLALSEKNGYQML